MATLINDESQVELALDLGVIPAPIIIAKGGKFLITNYNFGDNIKFVPEDLIAGDEFYLQIYDPELIHTIVLGVGATLTLNRDIFISGNFINLGGTVVGGQIWETAVPGILDLMAYSWESDLRVDVISNEVDLWFDNLEDLFLKAASDLRRPAFTESNSNFKDLPSIDFETLRDTVLTGEPGGLLLDSVTELTMYCVVDVPTSHTGIIFGTNSGSTTGIRFFSSGGNIFFAGTGGGGSSENRVVKQAGTMLLRTEFVEGNPVETQILGFINNGGSLTRNDSTAVSDVLSNSTPAMGMENAVNFPLEGSVSFMAIYRGLNNTPKNLLIEQYATRKYIRNTFGITTVEANDQKLTLSKATSIGDFASFTFILNADPVANNYVFVDSGFTQRVILQVDGTLLNTGVLSVLLFVDGVSVALDTDLRLHKGKVITITCTLNLGVDVDFVGGTDLLSSSFTIINFKIGTESFNLPEGSGLTTTGTAGTVATLINGASFGPYNGK